MRHAHASFAFLLTLSGLLLVSMPGTVHACGCELIEPDMAYQRAFLIFTGTVKEVTAPTQNVERDGKTYLGTEGRLTRFVVEEYFKGTGGAEVELRGGNTSCDIGFTVGKRYLVYASGSAGALGAYSCSRTRELDDHAKPDLSYLRRAAHGERPTMLYGFVFRSTGESKFGESEPLGDLAVTVESEGKQFDLKTDAGGYFEAFDLRPGSYRVHTGVTGKLRGGEEKTVELTADKVASVIFHTTTMGSLSGRLVDQEGQPVGQIIVELLPPGAIPGVGRITNYQTTGEDGRFVFAEVPAGRYVLAVNSRGRRSLYGAPFQPSYFWECGVDLGSAGHHGERRSAGRVG